METIERRQINERILEAAFNLFCQRGIRSVSMDDIAQHLGISKKTIYKWFSNKDEVVYAAVENYLAAVEQESERYMTGAANAIEELFNVIGMTKKIFSTIHPAVFYDLQKYHHKSWELWQSHKKDFILGKIRQNIERGIGEGLFRNDLDVEVMARLRAVMIELSFDARMFPPHEFEAARVQMVSLEHYMLGMATLKGHKLINKYKHITEEE